MTVSIQSSNASTALLHNGVPSVQFDTSGIISGADCGLKGVSAAVSANALTVTYAANQTLDFRSATLSNGAQTQLVNTSALSLTIPSGATLGTVSNVQSDLYLIVLNAAGAMELAVVNAAGGVDLSETGLISTTAISASAASAGVVYSAVARTGVAYRVVGLVRSTQAVAGTWSSAPALVQGAGGNALDAMMSLGYGQTWQNMTASRAIGTTYYNTTGKPIYVAVTISGAVTTYVNYLINGVIVGFVSTSTSYGASASIAYVVPPGASYGLSFSSGSETPDQWFELR